MFFFVSSQKLASDALVKMIGDHYMDFTVRHFQVLNEAEKALVDTPPKLIISDFIVGNETVHNLLKANERHACNCHTIVMTDTALGLKELLSRFTFSIIDKQSGFIELIKAIPFALNNQSYIDSSIAYQVLSTKHENPSIDNLSMREIEVLNCYLIGMKPDTIAKQLFVSVKTVRTHKANIMSKLIISSDIDLIKFGIKSKLITDCLAD